MKEGFGIAEGPHDHGAQRYTRDAADAGRPQQEGLEAEDAPPRFNIDSQSSTGAAKAVRPGACPKVKGKLTGMAFRIPTADGQRR